MDKNDIKNNLQNISEKMLYVFMNRAIKDAEQININSSNNQDLIYIIFRGYCIGYSLGKVEKSI